MLFQALDLIFQFFFLEETNYDRRTVGVVERSNEPLEKFDDSKEDQFEKDDPQTAWQQRRVVAVRDAGFTEVEPGTVTVLAEWR